ncbi:MAG: glycosyltransferase family 39 protein [Acidobacteriales bacterium]|nr:glycosyltransferase family 39 protein [Terriglobales bacterium]
MPPQIIGTLIANPAFQSTVKKSRDLWSKKKTSFFWLVAIAFILRLCLIFYGHTYRLRSDERHFNFHEIPFAILTNDDNFYFGFEMGRIGRSLASGEGFANPFLTPTGPTAWESPLYPFLIAGVFKIFGIYTHASAIALLSLNSLCSALTCIPIFLIALRCFNQRVAVWTAWSWAVLPPAMFWCTRWVWETSLTTLLLTSIFWITLTLEERSGAKPWIEFGLLWGITALTNTGALAFLPASGLWAWYRRSKRGAPSIKGVILASAIFFACITPWIARNYRVFGHLMFIRSNFGAELRLGNGPGADGTWMEYLHPTQNIYEEQRYRQLGEAGYVAARQREAIDFIRADYRRFLVLCVKRFVYFWAGRPRTSKVPMLAPLRNAVYFASSILAFWGLVYALRRRTYAAWLFFWLILSYTAVYYEVFPHPRYRHPIEPELGILIVYAISEAKRKTLPVTSV